MATVAILCQAAALFQNDGGGIHFREYSLFAAIAVFFMFSMVMLLVFDWRGNFPRSWFILSVAAAASSLLALIPADILETTSSTAVNLHQILATLAYSLFILAFVQMLEAFHRGREISKLQGRSPEELAPLLYLEGKVFTNILLGFVLLTLTISSGIYAGMANDTKLDLVNHKNIFAGLTWLTCLILVAGRYLRGWRGSVALKIFAVCVLFLFLSYVGTLFVLTVLLDR